MFNTIILLEDSKTSKTLTKLGKVSIKGLICSIEGLGGYLSPDLFENGLDADEHLPYHTLRRSYNMKNSPAQEVFLKT